MEGNCHLPSWCQTIVQLAVKNICTHSGCVVMSLRLPKELLQGLSIKSGFLQSQTGWDLSGLDYLKTTVCISDLTANEQAIEVLCWWESSWSEVTPYL